MANNLMDALKVIGTGTPTEAAIETFLKEVTSASKTESARALQALRDIEIKHPTIHTDMDAITNANPRKFDRLFKKLASTHPDFEATYSGTTMLQDELKGVTKDPKKLIAGTDTKYEKKLDKKFEKMTAEKYADVVGVKEKAGDAVRMKSTRHGFETVSGGEVGVAEKKIKDVHKKLENARAQLEKPWNADTTKGSGKTAKYEVEKLEKELESLGKSAQKEVHLASKKLNAYTDAFEKAHSEHLDKITKQQDKLLEALDAIKAKKSVTGDKKAASYDLKKKLGRDLTVEVDGEKFHITDKGGIVDKKGRPAPGKKFDEIMDAARSKVEDHFQNVKNRHEDAYERVKSQLNDRAEHLNKVKADFSEKTKVGEYTGARTPASVTSPGGKLAVEKGVIGEKAYLEKGGMGKATADINANLKGGGFAGKAKVVVGGIGIVDGARRAITAASNLFSGDQQKIDEAGWGTLVMGGAEAGAALMLARSGGRGIATGKTQAI